HVVVQPPPGYGGTAIFPIDFAEAAGLILSDDVLPVGGEAEPHQVRRPPAELPEAAGGNSAFGAAVEARAARVAHPAERFRCAHRTTAAHGEVSLAFRLPADAEYGLRVHVPPRRKRPHFDFAAQSRVCEPGAPDDANVLPPCGVGPPSGD